MADELILDVWREVGRHLELPELLDRVHAELERALSLSHFFARRIDLGGGCVETVAASARGSWPARTGAPPNALQALARWSHSGDPLFGRSAVAASGLTAWLPEPLPDGDVALVPLRPDNANESSIAGALVVVARPGVHHSKAQRGLLASLSEPFAAALANDCRIREMRTLREKAEADNRALLARLGRPSVGDVIVGAELGLRPVMERVALIARSDLPALILGETGTGKEVIARAIHTRSARADGPLIRVNCGAIPPELVDSELFGHERGSFTGATGTRKGWFERADGGTLFLDEIGELPLAAQVRLLRILQDGTFERVGGHASLTVHVRVIAATHRDLFGMVRDGRFREDLWYRICVFPIHLPALRERPDDVAPLATHFALKACRRLGLPPVLPTPEDLALLRGYSWPGNVRELNAVVERAAILGEGRRLEVRKALGTLPGGDFDPPPFPRAHAPEALPAPSPPAIVGESLDAAMARHIESALAASHGRVEGPFGAARRLGLNPHTLRARMRKLGIDWRRHRGLAP